MVCSANDGLYTTKLSEAIIYVFINSLFRALDKFEFFISLSTLAISFFIMSVPLISSIFSSREHTKVIFFSVFGSSSISYLPGTA